MAGKILKNPKIAEGIAKMHPLKRLGEGKTSAALAKFLYLMKVLGLQDKSLVSMVEDQM